MKRSFMKAIDIDGPVGRLEAVLATPADEPRAAAVLCHAHPLHGGTMHFKLLFRVAKLLVAKGVAVLRFNFRGVGRSEGEHDSGRGELNDAAAALDFLEREFPGRPLLLGGFSFGAVVALRVGLRDERVSAVVALGLPITFLGGLDVTNPMGKPVLFIQGERDEFGDARAIEGFVSAFPAPRALVVVPGSTHLFTDRIPQVERAVETWLEEGPLAPLL